MSRTITRADLSEAIYKKVGLSRGESAELVDQILDEISDALVKGEDVKLSSFATFSGRAKSERIGRNPKTGEERMISSRTAVSFKASHVLKSKVLKGNQKAKDLQRNKA